MSNAIQINTFPILGGTHTGGLGTIPVVGSVMLFRAPTNALGGGITVTEAYLSARAAGNGTFTLYKAAAGTPGTIGINGTLGAVATSSIAAGTQYSFGIGGGSAYVAPGEWLILGQTGSIIYPGGQIAISYQMGR